MWICDDNDIEAGLYEDKDVGNLQPGGGSIAVKPPGYYVSREAGLFPAPLPQDSTMCTRTAELFWFLGAFLAKTLQDNRLVDLPLSRPFLKMICQGEISRSVNNGTFGDFV